MMSVPAQQFMALLVGAGSIGARNDELATGGGVFTHAGGYRATQAIRLAASVEPDAERRAEFARRWPGVATYADLAAYARADGKCDIASVCTPDALHAATVRALLALPTERRPRLLWVEKPLAADTGQAAALAEECAAAGVQLAVNYQRRWEPVHCRLREDIASGALGDILAANCRYVRGLRHIGSTAVNTLRFLCGPISGVQALLSAPTGVADETRDFALYFSKGATALVQGCDRPVYAYSLFEIDILTTRGRVRLVDNGETMERWAVTPYPHYAGVQRVSLTETVATEMPRAFAHAAAYLARVLAGAPHTVNTSDEAVRDMRILDAVEASWRAGGTRLAVDG